MTDKTDARDTDLEWEQRVLCSDESCIGTIGPDGRCKECGLVYKGPLPEISKAIFENESDESDEQDEQDEQETSNDDNEQVISDDEWAQRKLCEDESCIGTIGPDGRCKECGRISRN